MKKFFAILTAVVLLVLAGCGEKENYTSIALLVSIEETTGSDVTLTTYQWDERGKQIGGEQTLNEVTVYTDSDFSYYGSTEVSCIRTLYASDGTTVTQRQRREDTYSYLGGRAVKHLVYLLDESGADTDLLERWEYLFDGNGVLERYESEKNGTPVDERFDYDFGEYGKTSYTEKEYDDTGTLTTENKVVEEYVDSRKANLGKIEKYLTDGVTLVEVTEYSYTYGGVISGYKTYKVDGTNKTLIKEMSVGTTGMVAFYTVTEYDPATGTKTKETDVKETYVYQRYDL